MGKNIKTLRRFLALVMAFGVVAEPVKLFL